MSDPEEYPFQPSPLPPVSGHDYSEKMMYVWMTDYVANSAAVVYQKAGLMSYTITDDMVCACVHVCVGVYVHVGVCMCGACMYVPWHVCL